MYSCFFLSFFKNQALLYLKETYIFSIHTYDYTRYYSLDFRRGENIVAIGTKYNNACMNNKAWEF